MRVRLWYHATRLHDGVVGYVEANELEAELLDGCRSHTMSTTPARTRVQLQHSCTSFPYTALYFCVTSMVTRYTVTPPSQVSQIAATTVPRHLVNRRRYPGCHTETPAGVVVRRPLRCLRSPCTRILSPNLGFARVWVERGGPWARNVPQHSRPRDMKGGGRANVSKATGLDRK